MTREKNEDEGKDKGRTCNNDVYNQREKKRRLQYHSIATSTYIYKYHPSLPIHKWHFIPLRLGWSLG